MKKTTLTLYLLLFCAAVSLGGCGLFDGEVRPEWENLGFPEPTAYKIFISDGKIYASAGYDGLYMLKGSTITHNKWQYLGHRVTEGEPNFYAGIQTIEVYQGIITVGYTSPPLQLDGQRIGVWRSADTGKTWQPADEGIRDTTHKWSASMTIARSPMDKSILLSGYGSIFKSFNSGENWTQIYPQTGIVPTLDFNLKWHPEKLNEVWAHGESVRFAPILRKSNDGGESWVSYDQINVPRDNAFYSLAFDADNPDIVYVGAQGAVIRSLNGGAEWLGEERVPALFTDKNGGFFYGLQTHPTRAGVLFAGAAHRLYSSKNYGETVKIIPTPKALTYIIDMWYQENEEALYVLGDGGIFRLNNPLEVL